MAQYNMRNPSVKRILREMAEMAVGDPSFLAEPLEGNIFEWIFAVRGPPETEFEGGVYMGRILLPQEYPFKPPAFLLLTPSGRFELNTKICLSISNHHPEHWQPSWSIRTALIALIAFFPSKPDGALGSLDLSKDERRRLAALSRQAPPNVAGVSGDGGERQEKVRDLYHRLAKGMPAPPPSPSAAGMEGERGEAAGENGGAGQAAEGTSPAAPLGEPERPQSPSGGQGTTPPGTADAGRVCLAGGLPETASPSLPPEFHSAEGGVSPLSAAISPLPVSPASLPVLTTSSPRRESASPAASFAADARGRVVGFERNSSPTPPPSPPQAVIRVRTGAAATMSAAHAAGPATRGASASGAAVAGAEHTYTMAEERLESAERVLNALIWALVAIIAGIMYRKALRAAGLLFEE